MGCQELDTTDNWLPLNKNGKKYLIILSNKTFSTPFIGLNLYFWVTKYNMRFLYKRTLAFLFQ